MSHDFALRIMRSGCTVTDVRTPLTCPVCGQTSTPTAKAPAVRCDLTITRRRRPTERQQAPVCADCAAMAAIESPDGTVTAEPPIGQLDRRRCEACGLQVAVQRDTRRTRHVCGDTCRRRLYRTATRPSTAVCAQCGKEFHARAGARYCSPGCRQQAYRNRTKI